MTEQVQTVIDAAERAAEAIRYDAEEQARRHLAEAQHKADRLTAERVGLISELTDDLVRHAANVRDHSEQMVRALEVAITSVTDKLEQSAMTNPFPIAEQPDRSLPFSKPLNAPANPPPPETVTESPSYTDLVGGRAVAQGFPPHPSPETVIASGSYNESPRMQTPPSPPAPHAPAPAPTEFAVSQEALMHVTRLAVAGEDRETIASALRDLWGVSDPDPIIDRILGRD